MNSKRCGARSAGTLAAWLGLLLTVAMVAGPLLLSVASLKGA